MYVFIQFCELKLVGSFTWEKMMYEIYGREGGVGGVRGVCKI